MKKTFLLTLLTIILLSLSSSAFAYYIPLVVKNSDSISICARQYYQINYDDETATEMEWSTSNESVFRVIKSLDKHLVIATGLGSAYLNGNALNGSGKAVKIKITVPKVYTTHEKVVIDSPEGIEFGYSINLSGYNSISKNGTSTKTERLVDVGEITMCKILPVKVGTDTYVFENNGKRIKTVQIEVKKSAFEVPTTIPEGTCIALVIKDVNVRKEPNADSRKMGSAKKDDTLIVTQAFYTNKWHQISFNGETCYVSANYCEIIPVESPESSTNKTPATSDTILKLDKYIRKFSLTEDCKNVLLQYLPNINEFSKIEQEALLMYAIHMHDGTKYYLTIMQNKEPACLQSSETDYNKRTRYYDKFAK